MWEYILFTMSDEHEKRLKKQEEWRQKQLDLFYRTGKPIFTMTHETLHIRSNNNPYYYKDKR